MRARRPIAGMVVPAVAVFAVATALLSIGQADSTPITTREGVLPPGTELNEDALDKPTEIFSSEAAGGKRSYLLNLGDIAFSSPMILGGLARKAGISCNTCHQSGAGNPKLYIPGLSGRPGTFDTSNALFNPKADNGVFDPVTPPSLRGARYLAPYGHDGRFVSLREFVLNVVVNEFAGPEPSAQILDALVAYIQEISFLPNSKLGESGRLTDAAPEAARRGEFLFNKPFPHAPLLSCASCHQPSAAFVDHKVHDVGSGGLFKTPTLLNANFNAPYFHDGRYETYHEVVQHFDRTFGLDLAEQDRNDIVAYLRTVGDAEQPYARSGIDAALDEIEQFASVLDAALPARNLEVINLAVDTVGNEWREVSEKFLADKGVFGGLAERRAARRAALAAALSLRQIAMSASDGDFDEANRVYADYRQQFAAARPILRIAEAWSLFNPRIHEQHFATLKQLNSLARGERQ